MKRSVYKTIGFLVFVLAMGEAQQTTKAVALSDTLATPIMLTHAPLSSFATELSEKTKIAICFEDLVSGDRGTLEGISITFSSAPGQNIREILDQIHAFYPQLSWRLRGGIIVLMSSALADWKEDPLGQKVSATELKGDFDSVKSYLMAGVPGFNAAILQTKGAVKGDKVYEMQISPEMTVRDVLVMLTRKYGLLWSVKVRPRNTGIDNGFPTIILSFTQGDIPADIKEQSERRSHLAYFPSDLP